MSTVNKETNIKKDWLIPAGPIFAVNGYAGASIRDIIQKAGATLSSVNYFFGSKDQLYLETIPYVLGEKIDIANIFRQYIQTNTKTRQEISHRLFPLVHDLLLALSGMDHPSRYGKFLARVMSESKSEANRLIVDILEPFIQNYERFYTSNCRIYPRKPYFYFFGFSRPNSVFHQCKTTGPHGRWIERL